VVASPFTSTPWTAKIKSARLSFSLADVFGIMRRKMARMLDINGDGFNRL